MESATDSTQLPKKSEWGRGARGALGAPPPAVTSVLPQLLSSSLKAHSIASAVRLVLHLPPFTWAGGLVRTRWARNRERDERGS